MKRLISSIKNLFVKPVPNKFARLENLDAPNLEIEIIKLSIKDKAEMLLDILQWDDLTQNNIRAAIVIQMHLIDELKPMVKS